MTTRTMIPIPAGTPTSACRSCRQPIYWAPHPSTQKNHPVSIDTKTFPAAKAPTSSEAGQGGTHFADCPNAKTHRKAR